MRIAFVNATRRWGGVKTWMLAFAAGLVARGHVVRVYGRQPEFAASARAAVGHGERVSFGADLNPVTIRQFRRRFRAEGIEAVILNVGKDLATAGVAARLEGLPVIQRIGLPRDIPYRFKTRLLHRWINPWFLCPCRFIAEGFRTSLPYLRPERIKVVLNGKTPSTGALRNHAPRVLLVTQQLCADKGHAALFRALAGVEQPWRLGVAGTGDMKQELQELAQHLGLSGRLTWHGFSSDVSALIREADIFVLASQEEGLPNTLLEAMAGGLLPIVRDVGGVREVMPPELEDWVLPFSATAEDFRTAVRAALALPEAAFLHLREQARAACRTRFLLEERVAELETWLGAVINEGAPSREKRTV